MLYHYILHRYIHKLFIFMLYFFFLLQDLLFTYNFWQSAVSFILLCEQIKTTVFS